MSKPMGMLASRHISQSWDHVNWWEPEHWKPRAARSVDSVSLEGADPADIRNGWLTLPDPQAKFQQKQMQERELKIASLYEAQQARALDRVRHSPGSGHAASPPAPAPPLAQPGKVRQMFEERRTKAGIDKSYPLQPINSNGDRPPRKTLPNGYTKVATKTTEKRSVKSHTSVNSNNVRKHHHKTENIINGSDDLNHNHVNHTKNNNNTVQRNNDAMIPALDELDRGEYLLENETFPEGLQPATPRSPEPQPQPKRPPRRSPAALKTSPVKPKPPTQPAVVPPPRRPKDNATIETNRSRGAMQRPSQPIRRPTKQASNINDTRVSSARAGAGAVSAEAGAGAGEACAVCGRRFAPERLRKHEDICRKSHAKKRKPFDVLKHRLQGTEAEPFIGKLRKSGPQSSQKIKPLNNNWRQKHDEFIQAIRAAKQVQAHINAGGKLSDLPPPPPSENPDYVSCPHCGRRFNQGAAERHIPKCANYQFNKPKPSVRKR